MSSNYEADVSDIYPMGRRAGYLNWGMAGASHREAPWGRAEISA
jgi:hypothetical protein